MTTRERKQKSHSKVFDPRNSIKRAGKQRATSSKWVLTTSRGKITWGNKIERVAAIRNGLPYESVEVIGQKANLPVKHVLHYLGVPQTTYNKKKKGNELMSGRNSEVILILSEVLDFGLEVFNNEEEKFHRWLRKPNLSLGDVTPESLFDSVTGIQEVRNTLNRLEFGNLA
ncbi:MAG: antitoxin Xre/MbcA/ParS toxin-binding domain-containing protein [bacterium]